jgi:hypothetical protein
MARNLPQENAAGVLGITLVAWGATVTIGDVEGVFAKLPPEVLRALALFALAYAPAMVLLDRPIREYLWRADARALGIVAALFFLFGFASAIGRDGRLEPAPGPVLACFVVPVLAALFVAAIDRALNAPRAPRSAPAKSPGATPAAT